MTAEVGARSKLVYLVPRPARFEHRAFMRRWREHAHVKVGSMPSCDGLTRYQQCGLLTPEEAGLPPALFGPGGLSLAYGGVGVAWFENAAGTPDGARPDLGPRRALENELDAFGAPLGANLHATEEEVIFDKGGTQVRIFSFLHRRSNLTLAEFSAQWRAFADTFLAHEELARHCTSYVQDHVIEAEGESRFDGIAEMGFRDPGGALGLLSEPTLAHELFREEEPFLDRTDGVVVLTRPERLVERRLPVESQPRDDESALVGHDDELGTVAGGHLRQDPRDMRLHRQRTDDQTLGDLGIGRSACD
jgi:hypothetical protein